MVITFISDTHTKHRYCENDLPGGDLLIHAGDVMNSGYDENDVWEFLNWFNKQEQYKGHVFIAGNHDRFFENKPNETKNILREYPKVTYLQDNSLLYVNEDTNDACSIYGSPHQPEFHNWAFNLPRNGEELQNKWNNIPKDIDILITHGPAWGHLDVVPYGHLSVGCELLRECVDVIKPKIHVFGHVHSGYGYKFHNGTHFFNASVLDERYSYSNKPITIDWNPEHNTIKFI
jgi:Icc-related predicted phosphoesterase